METDKIRNILFHAAERDQKGRCYVILDAAKSDVIYERLKDETGEGTSLFIGEKKTECAQVAPYLIKLSRVSPFTQWLFENGWERDWGMFLSSSHTLEALRKHFRMFLMAFDENGRSFYFRYYDPNILKVFLQSCLMEELRQFFGPVEAFFVRDRIKQTMDEYRLEEDQLSQMEHRI